MCGIRVARLRHMQRIAILLLTAALAAACGSDNASPMTHGAKNKPSDVSQGETKSNIPPPDNPDAPPQPAGAEGTYGESGGSAGGDQATKK
jgi:hypothetical protein